MCETLLPNDEELNFRKTHYKRILDVLDGDICCAICNSDLKKDIILNEDIMIHEIFLCLCCEKCFEKLSNSPNGCIFCSQNVNLKTCEICNREMCERCIDNYCSMSKYQKTLKGCLRCSTNALWSHRSQAAAVLKCFSFELDLRLILSGKDSLDKQNICEFIISTAKCDDFTPNDIHRIRVKYLYYLLNSKIEQAFYDYQTLLQTKDTKQCIGHFIKLCELILKSTCETLLEFKCLFNEEIIESFNNKVVSILRNSPLFNKTENSYDKTWAMSCPNLNVLNCRKNGLSIDYKSSNVLTPNCSMSWGKPMVNKYSSNMVADEPVNLNAESNININFTNEVLTDNAASQTVHENIEKRVETINSFCGGNIKNFANYNPFRGRYVFKMLDADTMICQINDSEKLINETINESSESSSNINSIRESTLPEINMTICDHEDTENKNTSNEELINETDNVCTESSSNIDLISERIWPEINLTICDQDDTYRENEKKMKEMLVDETINENSKSSSNINSICENTWPEINLTICDQEDTENENENANTFNEELISETVNVSSKFSSNINLICENTWPKIYLTRCDQKNNADENKNKLNGEPVNVITESSSNINSICGSMWPKVYLTRYDQKNINNENENKFSKELIDESVNVNSESNSNINSIHESDWPKVYLTRYDQKDINNENENKISKGMVCKTVNLSTESSSFIKAVSESAWPKIYLTKYDQMHIDNENENTLNKKKVDVKPLKINKKRKFQEKPNSVQSHSYCKKNKKE